MFPVRHSFGVSNFHVTPTICREGLKIQANVIDQLVQGAQSDIRQVINMLSTWKLSNVTMDFDEGKALYVEIRLPLFSLRTLLTSVLSEPK